MELLRLPTILLAVLRGGFMFAGCERFLAGLYVGLGSLGKEAASWVFNGSFGGCGGALSRGPGGRLEEW